MKAMPQLLYGNLTQRHLWGPMQKLRSAILHIAWGTHRALRCGEFVLILIRQGHRIDPFMADDYRNFTETHRLLQYAPRRAQAH